MKFNQNDLNSLNIENNLFIKDINRSNIQYKKTVVLLLMLMSNLNVNVKFGIRKYTMLLKINSLTSA